MNPRVVAVLQARMSSSRLPGKVLKPLGHSTVIGFMLDRLRRAGGIDQLIVATSDDPSDDALAAHCATLGTAVFRGSLNDVLSRFAGAAAEAGADIVVRLTGDCPLIEPGVIDAVIGAVRDGADYASNVAPPTFPDGLDCEAFTATMLREAAQHATLPSDREHVTPFIRRRTDIRQANIAAPSDLSALRWTIDHPDDLAHVAAMIGLLDGDPVAASLADWLRAEQLAAASGAAPAHARNEGYALSLSKEAPRD